MISLEGYLVCLFVFVCLGISAPDPIDLSFHENPSNAPHEPIREPFLPQNAAGIGSYPPFFLHQNAEAKSVRIVSHNAGSSR
jgi:hypothetical protein